ncbi:Rieske (2Fe-2S) protein [Mycobacterium sp.]|jgi:Rieske Fe-S protein|uniref:QcrA and Rieske domain-containing protein n=1 Tax=Mycobacterium sp. TaxID=1785 RepID=UPI002D3D76DD|nr:Rieske (2Fe-2S) protein [Mycobacterium sp.]HZA10189.1 Rieske (2Fe-2S) protein [Mycobacterium sp.]
MNARGLRRYVDDLLRDRRPTPFRPGGFEAAQIRTAIELRAARPGADEPRGEFLADLHRRVAAQMEGEQAPATKVSWLAASRRQVVVGLSAAAAAVVATVTADRLLFRDAGHAVAAGGDMVPKQGRWQPVTASSDVTGDGVMHPFETDSLFGFVRRVDGRPEAVSGVCTHQGCRLFFDQPAERLRCPCHFASFAPTGQVLTHPSPRPLAPLPRLEVREVNGTIEVFAPAEPA